MDLSWPVCEGEWDCLPLPRGFQGPKGEMCCGKDWAWWHNKGKKIGSFRASGRGRHDLVRDWMSSQQQLRSNSDLALQLA